MFLTLLLPESMLTSMGCATTRDHIRIHGPTVAGSLVMSVAHVTTIDLVDGDGLDCRLKPC